MPAAPGSADLLRQPAHGNASSSGQSPKLQELAPSAQATAESSTSSSLSIAEYRAAHARKHGSTVMSKRSSSQAGAQSSSKPKLAGDVLFEDFKEGMGPPTDGPEGSPGAGHRPQSPARSRSRSPMRSPPRSPLRTPNPFSERGTGASALRNAPPLPSRDEAEDSNVVTNDLDEAQSQQLDVRHEASRSNIPAALPLAKKSRKDYVV
ncbi:hypothetical protein PF005_g25026 [Phytophthora fragariae]|uniref:Uncharacterized protein n=2 Tax=Phytophthora fragariae TaxID=53985 RepID=A0A6A3RAU1_9STRA|nr:hypothetical protein PF003_g8783 [Phytophthora fragariae]KAE9074583.1 hypothetical protein PF007_g25351 [Phytophthora fragariae]KAE9092902.1 hypothetical protein PF006_g24575 [Phytophthora fragariae]KAE9176291.1 hypothetical protein PF005_g25026 [Phytophthora fragariae]